MAMFRSKILWPGLLAACVAAAVAGCGGGGGGSSTPAATPTTPSSPTTTTSVVSKGVISGFGSVYVNGERYDLDDDTRVNVDDEDERVGDDGALRLGMKVRIDASERDGRLIAQSIVHRRDLKGPVTSVMVDADDPSIGTFRVAGTLVVADGETIFDVNVGDNDGNGSIDIRDLAVSSGRMVVAVSGFAGDDGYLATRVSRKSGVDDDDDIEIKGFVDAIDTAGSTFVVSGTRFIVSSGTEFEDGLGFDDSLLGVFVDVEGRITADGYVATEVAREDDDDDRSGRFEIEGILVSVDTGATPDQVQIGNRILEVTDASALVGLVGAKVEIKGSFNPDGVLVIEQVRAKGGDVKLEDSVVSVDAAAGTVITRLGLVVRPEPTSRLEDDDDDDDRLTPAEFLNRLRGGDPIEARGFVDSAGSVVWTRIEREDDDDDAQECELQGPVEAVAADQTSFDILGVTVDVVSGGSVEFEDEHDDDIGRTAFFARLQVGDVVKAKSDDDDVNGCQNGLLIAEEVEFERGASAPVLPPNDGGGSGGGAGGSVVFLVIDEDSIDNGNPPNDFSETDVNDDIVAIGQRTPLRFFQNNPGSTIDLFTGQVGDEGWFALKTIPSSWQSAGPGGNGTRNFLEAGPGLGGPPGGDNREVLLDEVPDVTPLRATGLAMLVGQTVCAVVQDSDVSINYSPLQGNLQGASLGTVAFDVLQVTERTDGSTSDLPRVAVRLRDAAACDGTLLLFANAPVPSSSSEPMDLAPPAEPPAARFVAAP